jgi:PAS domain S-box-containing protein
MIHYFYDGRDLGLTLESHYDIALVLLSISIIILASYAALSVANRIGSTDSITKRRIWLLAGSVTLGGGVWSMHFIGMLAYKLPIAVSYDFLITMVSVVPAILGAYFMLLLISRDSMGKYFLTIVTLLLGLIGTMHLIGMLAMRGISQLIIMMFEPKLFIVAGTVSTLVNITAVTVNFNLGRSKKSHNALWAKVGAAIFIGLGFASLHYGAMWSTYFFPGDPVTELNETSLNDTALLLWVSFASVFIALLAIFIAVVDKRIEQATRDEQVSRTRMHEAIESIADGFCLFDTQDRLLECNQRYREIMDFGEPITHGMTFETIMGKASKAGLILDALGREDEWLEQRVTKHHMPRENFIEHLRGERWMQVSERRVWNTGTVAICRDVTELKQVEIELSKAIEEIKKARDQEMNLLSQMMRAESALERQRSLTQAVAGVAHEINTPLGIIKTGLSIINQRLSLPKVQQLFKEENMLEEMLKDILECSSLTIKNVDTAHRLIGNFKKIAVNQEENYKETANVVVLLQDAIDQFKVSAKQANIEIHLDTSGIKKGLEWHGFPGYLSQILMNFLQNIERYAYPNGIGGKVNITVADQEGHNSDVKFILKVRDFGKGINPNDMAKIFDPFFTTGRDKGGTGLGLAIVNNMVTDAMQGTMSVESEPGCGTCFTVCFPKNLSDSV